MLITDGGSLLSRSEGFRFKDGRQSFYTLNKQ